MRSTSFILVLALLVGLAACGRRVDPPPPPAPHSAWTSADSAQVAAQLAEAALKHPWAAQFRDRHGRIPTLRVGQIDDRSGDLVPVAGFAAELTRCLGQSDRVSLSGGEADVAILGSIGMKPELREGRQVNWYQIDLKVVDVASGETLTPLPLEHEVAVPAPAAPAAK